MISFLLSYPYAIDQRLKYSSEELLALQFSSLSHGSTSTREIGQKSDTWRCSNTKVLELFWELNCLAILFFCWWLRFIKFRSLSSFTNYAIYIGNVVKFSFNAQFKSLASGWDQNLKDKGRNVRDSIAGEGKDIEKGRNLSIEERDKRFKLKQKFFQI